MGGNAFKKTKRLTEEAYQAMCRQISEILSELNLQHRYPPEIKDKGELVLGKHIITVA